VRIRNSVECLDDLRHFQSETADCSSREAARHSNACSVSLKWEGDTVEEVIAVSFHDRRRAAQAFNLLWQMNDKLIIEVDDAVIVHRDQDGNLEYDREFSSVLDRGLVRAGLTGAIIGALAVLALAVGTNATLEFAALGVCVLAGGLVGIAIGARNVAANATWWEDHLRVAKWLTSEVVDDIEADDLAVVAWVNSAGLEMAASAFRGFGGKVLRTTLPPEEVAKLESVLKG
jgi:uncharacterized membrane protein